MVIGSAGASGLHVAEPPLDEPARVRDVDIAGDDQARIGRRIELLEKRDDVFVARGREIRHVADDGPVIRMALRIQHLAENHVLGGGVRPVLNALASLVLHDVALRVDGLRRHRVEEISHAVGFEKQRELERIRRHVDPVVRAVVFGRSVVLTAGAFKPRIELARLDVAGSHEHQMFEEMRKSGSASAFPSRADVVPDVHAHHGHAVVFVKNHVQSVGQRELRVWKLKGRRVGCE